MLLDILIILLLTAINGFLSLSEMALVSARTARLKELATANGGNAGARAALQLKQRPGRFLSTVQIGITLVGIFAGAFGGTQLSDPLAAVIDRVPVLAPYGGEIAIAFVVLSITFLTLLLGELVPKNIALGAPERIASGIAGIMRWLSLLLTPGVFVLDHVSRGVLALFGRPGAGAASVTEEEIRYFVAEGAAAGAIESEERDMIYRIIRLGDKTAEDLMTPRLRIVALDADASPEENFTKIRGHHATRFPVYRGEVTNIIGVVRVKDLLNAAPGVPLDPLHTLHPPLYVPETTPSHQLLETLQSSDLHMGIVVDEYGTIKGLVTLSDIMRAVMGEAAEMSDVSGPVLRRRADGSVLVDGLRAADDLKDVLRLSLLPAETGGDYHTVAGLVVANLHTLPEKGDGFDYQGWRFTVLDMDGQRVHRVLITRTETGEEEGASGI
jgi:putative hemolysin